MASKKTKVIVGAAAAAAALAGIIYGAKKLHEKGYDKMAVKRLRDYSKKLRAEAARLEKKLSSTKKAAVKKKSVKKKKKK